MIVEDLRVTSPTEARALREVDVGPFWGVV